MSAKATFWAWQQKGLSSSAKLVLLCLADCHNADSGRCDPSASYISEQTELNVKTIPTAIKKLQERGILFVDKRKGKTDFYTLNIPQNWGGPNSGIPKNGVPQKRASTAPKNGVSPPPKLGYEPISNLKENLKELYKGLDLSEVDDSFDLDVVREFVDHRINKKSKLTQKSLIRNLNEALKVLVTPQLNLTPNEVIEQTIDADWKGVNLNWLITRLGGGNNANSYQSSSLSGSTKISTVEQASNANREHYESLQRRIADVRARSGDDPAMGAVN